MADPSRSSSTAATAESGLLAPSNDEIVAPSTAEIVAPVPTTAAPDMNAGFQRPEFGKEKLAGTVAFHERHVFLCYKSPDAWPSDLDAAETDHLPGLLAAEIDSRKSELKRTTKLSICEGDVTESSFDVLLFPDMIRYRGVTQSNIHSFVEEALVRDIQWLGGSFLDITGSYVFVCAHGSKDKRCGTCGPALLTRFKGEICNQHLDGQVTVRACSDIGGHKYAGHIIIFRSDAKGPVTGDWYGYVAPDDVPVLLHKHIGQGEIIDNLWRGQLGMSEEQQLKAMICSHEQELGPVMQGNILIPPNFKDDEALNHFEVHGFRTAKQLKDAVTKTKKWLPTKMAAALLTNGSVFAVETTHISDDQYEVNGAICVIRNEELAKIHRTGHLYTTKVGFALKDRQPETVPIGEFSIIRCDFGGNRWTLRKFSVKGDDRFVILQWPPRATNDEVEPKKSFQPSKKVIRYE